MQKLKVSLAGESDIAATRVKPTRAPNPNAGKRKIADPRGAAVDELIELHQKLTPYEDAIKRCEELKKTVRGWAETDGVPAEAEHCYSGSKGMVTLGRRENERKFKTGAIRAIYKTLGLEGFLGVCSMTLKAAEVALGDRLAEFVFTGRTGWRPITILRSPEPQPWPGPLKTEKAA